MAQVIKLIKSILSLVTCGFSSLDFLVPDLDLDLVARVIEREWYAGKKNTF